MYALRASAAGGWVLCGGRVRLTRDTLPFDDDEDTTVREEGTAGHWAAEQGAHGRPVPVGTIAPNGVEITDEIADGVAQYLAALAEWDTAQPRHIEVPVHCAGIHDECGGTPDAFAWCPLSRTVFIGDLKLGYRLVQEWPNWQMLCYLDGVMRHFYLQPGDVNRVAFMICQPRAYGHAPVRSVSVTLDDVRPYWHTLMEAAEIAMSPDAPCVTNPGCLDCDGRHRCNALQQAAANVLDFAHANAPHDLAFGAAERELRTLHWARSIVEGRITGLEQQVAHAMKRGASSRHFELAQSAGRLAWTEEGAQKARKVAALLGVDIKKPEALITPTQAADKLGESIVNMYASRRPGALKLVPTDANKWRRIFGVK